MGRRAQYHTIAAKNAAANARRALMSQTEWYPLPHSPRLLLTRFNNSARSVKSAINHVAYRKQHRRQGTATIHLPKLPLQLLLHASLPLPHTSYFFSEALSSAENLDESDLGRWDLDPPYTLLASDPPGEVYTKHLAEVMHGRRLRQQEERDRAWEIQRAGMSCREQREVIALELKTALEQWKWLDSFVPEYQGGVREVRMAAHLLQWRARTVYHLKEKWETIV